MGVDNWVIDMATKIYNNVNLSGALGNIASEHCRKTPTVLNNCIISSGRIWEFNGMFSIDHNSFAIEFYAGETLITIKNIGDENFAAAVDNFWNVRRQFIRDRTEMLNLAVEESFVTTGGIYKYQQCRHALVYAADPTNSYIYINTGAKRFYIPFNVVVWNNLEKNNAKN